MTTSYVIDAVRTPRGRGKQGKGALSRIHPQELCTAGGQGIATILERVS